MVRKVIYVSGTRADYGLMSRSLKLWKSSGRLDVSVCVTGMHLLEAYGMTVNEILADKLKVCGQIPVNLSGDSGAMMAKAIADALSGMVDVFTKEKPDIVIVLGDRGEMLAGALAAIHLNIPIVHIHGGERSGTVDEPVRHAISKLSHYHFTATEDARNRLIRMGELADRVFIVGAPGLDGLEQDAVLSRSKLCEDVGFSVDVPVILLLFHPVVQDADVAGEQIKVILNALQKFDVQVLCLMPNADAGGSIIRSELEIFQQHKKKQLHLVRHLPRQSFVSWLKHADVMVGNSSSGIIEAATFNTPVVNVGNRQVGRERSANVIDVEIEELKIRHAIELCLSQPRRSVMNVYGEGCSGQRMLDLLVTLPMDKEVLNKLNAY